jgi:nitrate reductase NapE
LRPIKSATRRIADPREISYDLGQIRLFLVSHPSAMPEHPPEKKSELKAFLFLTVVMAPALAGIVIATYGLCVWIYQMFAGPPTS